MEGCLVRGAVKRWWAFPSAEEGADGTGAELTHHLGYEKGDPAGQGSGNSRNGHSAKTVLSEDGELPLAIPRDRAGTFEPKIVPKGVTRLDGFDAKVLSLYARGLTVREIQGHLKEIYGTEVSPDLISRVTDAVLEEVKDWQGRPLDACYPIVFFDALRVKIRDEGLVKNKAVKRKHLYPVPQMNQATRAGRRRGAPAALETVR